MTPNEYQDLANRTAPTSYPTFEKEFHSDCVKHVLHAMLGITSEMGETADNIKKFLIYSRPLDFENILEECGDKLWYISLLLSACGWSLEQAMEHNINKLRIRYPEKFTEKDAIERKDKIIFSKDDVC